MKIPNDRQDPTRSSAFQQQIPSASPNVDPTAVSRHLSYLRKYAARPVRPCIGKPARGSIGYWSFRYRLTATDMVICDGVFFHTERHIPYDRIHNVDLIQRPLQRLLGVAEVQLHTANGDKPEAVLRVLSVGVAAWIGLTV